MQAGFLRCVRVAVVAGFAVVAFGHPDGFYGLLIGATDQVTLSSVYGLKDLNDGGAAYLPAPGRQTPAQGLGEGGDFIQLHNSLTVQGFSQLAAAPGWLACCCNSGGKGRRIQAEKRREALGSGGSSI
jgi:hypothetical protein